MTIVVGLGNPGSEYANTRHNAGIMLVDYLSTKLDSNYGWRRQYGILVFKSDKLVLVKTADYFMNESQHVLRDLAKIMPLDPQNLYLVHDDLDLEIGEYRIQNAKGPKAHNGVDAIESGLGTKEFWRVRIGIDARNPENRIAGDQYVLQNFSREEREAVNDVFDNVCNHLNK